MKDIEQLMVLSVKNVSYYKYAKKVQTNSDFNGSYGIAKLINTENEQGSIDLKERAVKQVSKSVESDCNGKVLTDQELEAYLIGDTLYTKKNGKWTRSIVVDSAKSLEEHDTLKSLVDLLSRSDLKSVGTETIDGQKCYKLKIGLEPHIAYSMLVTQSLAAHSVSPVTLPKISLDDLSESNVLLNNSKISCTVWITADTYRPMGMDRQTMLALTPECLKTRSENMPSFKIVATTNESIRFSDFNVQGDIALPDEARNAVPKA